MKYPTGWDLNYFDKIAAIDYIGWHILIRWFCFRYFILLCFKSLNKKRGIYSRFSFFLFFFSSFCFSFFGFLCFSSLRESHLAPKCRPLPQHICLDIKATRQLFVGGVCVGPFAALLHPNQTSCLLSWPP